jgi:hypothetical protein
LRSSTLLLLTLAAGAASAAACENTVEEDCLSGPCGPVQPGPSSSISSSATSGGGDGGSGGGVACTGDEFPATGDLPCDVWQVLHDRCHCCHQDPPKNFAPFPLLTYELTREVYSMTTGKLRWERMAEVIQPEGAPHMPLLSAAQLSSTQKQVLDDWFAACAPPASEYGDGGPGCDEQEPPPTMCDPP